MSSAIDYYTAVTIQLTQDGYAVASAIDSTDLLGVFTCKSAAIDFCRIHRLTVRATRDQGNAPWIGYLTQL